MSQIALVVDDVLDWREMIAGVINDFYPHVRVISAGSLDEAKGYLEENVFDVAIIDLRLDESDENNTDGVILAKHIHHHYPQTSALVVIGYATIETVHRSMQPDERGDRPVLDYIQKRDIHHELRPRIEQALAKGKERRRHDNI